MRKFGLHAAGLFVAGGIVAGGLVGLARDYPPAPVSCASATAGVIAVGGDVVRAAVVPAGVTLNCPVIP